jgi:hypothetical protein
LKTKYLPHLVHHWSPSSPRYQTLDFKSCHTKAKQPDLTYTIVNSAQV